MVGAESRYSCSRSSLSKRRIAPPPVLLTDAVGALSVRPCALLAQCFAPRLAGAGRLLAQRPSSSSRLFLSASMICRRMIPASLRIMASCDASEAASRVLRLFCSATRFFILLAYRRLSLRRCCSYLPPVALRLAGSCDQLLADEHELAHLFAFTVAACNKLLNPQ